MIGDSSRFKYSGQNPSRPIKIRGGDETLKQANKENINNKTKQYIEVVKTDLKTDLERKYCV